MKVKINTLDGLIETDSIGDLHGHSWTSAEVEL